MNPIAAKFAGRCAKTGKEYPSGTGIVKNAQGKWEIADDKAEVAISQKVSKPEVKRCWECGCEFTYADCKRNDGDWNENGGYCGC